MSSIIKLKRSSTGGSVPLAADLVVGELAINLVDKKLYSYDGTNVITVAGATADALTTARAIALSGDVTGTVNFDGSAGVSISTTIASNAVTLGADTTGNYLATAAGTSGEITVTGSGGEGGAITIGLPTDVDVAGQLTVGENIVIAGNTHIDGNLTVEGSTTYISSSTVHVDDSMLKLSSNNAADTVDTGVYGKYVAAATAKYSGYFRDATDGVFKFYDGLTVEPTGTVNAAHATYNLATIEAVIDGGTY